MLPSTVERVPRNTPDAINAWIRERTMRNIDRYRHASPAEIDLRLQELDQEWDVERMLEANAATAVLIGLSLGATVDQRWFIFPAIVGGFLLQHALQGWCPPLPIFRGMGVRTSYEIDEERFALQAFRKKAARASDGAFQAA